MPAALDSPAGVPDENQASLQEYWDTFFDNRWLIGLCMAVALVIGAAYAIFASPVFESDLLIQVEDSAASPKSFLGEAASFFDVKTPATAEMEIIRSRMIIGKAVDTLQLDLRAEPHYLPVVGRWLSRQSKSLTGPGVLGMGSWVWGAEKIELARLEVPRAFEGRPFVVTALENRAFTIEQPDFQLSQRGVVGQPLEIATPQGPVRLLVARLEGRPGAEFHVVRSSRLDVISALQRNLKLAEKGRQSGVIEATLNDTDRERLAAVLNEIGRQYVRQNIERKAAEAQKTLSFLDAQLPQFRKQLEASEEAYNQFRNRKGTISLDEEARLILRANVDLQSKLLEAQQKRVELLARFTPDHPAIKTLDEQIKAWNAEIAATNGRVKNLPLLQQDALRYERDVKVNNELYQQLRNNALQLQLIREGKIGNARLIDEAVVPERPVQPRKLLTLTLAALLGLLAGIIAALVRHEFFSGLQGPGEIEEKLGLSVFSTVPLSEVQQALAVAVSTRQEGMHVLAERAPQDSAVESLRSLRTALQFSMTGAPNNRVLVTGPTPGVGKSFVSVNLASVYARSGKRTLLVDADLRRGHVNQYFGLSRAEGLCDLILGTSTFDKAITRGVIPNLDVLTTGAMPSNPADLVVSEQFASLLQTLSGMYDLVIIDSAPLLVAADTVAISRTTGTILLVARAGESQLGQIGESARRLMHAGSRVSGVVFNGLDLSRRNHGQYGYRYGNYRYAAYDYSASRNA